MVDKVAEVDNKVAEVGGKVAEVPTKQYIDNAVKGKQDTLVSGTNIKTINGESILGEGDVKVDSKDILYLYYSDGELPDDLKQHNISLLSDFNFTNNKKEFCIYQQLSINNSNYFAKVDDVIVSFHRDEDGVFDGLIAICTLWQNNYTRNRYKSHISFIYDGKIETIAYREQDEVISIPELDTFWEYKDAFIKAGFNEGLTRAMFNFKGNLAYQVDIGNYSISVNWWDDFNSHWNTYMTSYEGVKETCYYGGFLVIGNNVSAANLEVNKGFLKRNMPTIKTLIIHSEYGYVNPIKITTSLDKTGYDIIIFHNEQLETWRISASDGTSALVTEDTVQFATKQEVIDNEEVTALALNKIREEQEINIRNLKSEFYSKTQVDNEINKVLTNIIDNEEVVATSVNELRSLIRGLQNDVELLKNAQ